MSKLFLAKKQLAELTGYVKYAKQVEWLSRNGYYFDIRSDGKPNILLRQIEERQKIKQRTEERPQANLSFLERGGRQKRGKDGRWE